MLQGIVSRHSSTLWLARPWQLRLPRRAAQAHPLDVAVERCHVTSQTATSGGEAATMTSISQQNLVGHLLTPTSAKGRNRPSARWPTNTTMPPAARSTYILALSFSGVTCFVQFSKWWRNREKCGLLDYSLFLAHCIVSVSLLVSISTLVSLYCVASVRHTNNFHRNCRLLLLYSGVSTMYCSLISSNLIATQQPHTGDIATRLLSWAV